MDSAKPVPIPNPNISNFNALEQNTLYVDKTLFLKDLIDRYPDGGALLFARPRWFGKTMLATMVKRFFEMPGSASDAFADASPRFRDKLIWSCGPKYQERLGAYPVIWLSFGAAKSSTWSGMYTKLCHCLCEEASRHPELQNSDRCTDRDRRYIQNLLDDNLDAVSASHFLDVLTRMLTVHYGAPCVLIIDDYDVPLQESSLHGYLDDVKEFYGGLLSAGLKDNENLKYGILTGILPVVQTGIFGGPDNLDVYTVLDNPFSGYFGFTEPEVRKIARLCGKEDHMEEICRWYDGYQFGDTKLFNPWSVLRYFQTEIPDTYWKDPSENSMLQDLLQKAGPQDLTDIQTLANWKPGQAPLRRWISFRFICPEMGKPNSNFLSFLVLTGYLKCVRSSMEETEPLTLNDCVDLSIPNLEIAVLLSALILVRFFPG